MNTHFARASLAASGTEVVWTGPRISNEITNQAVAFATAGIRNAPVNAIQSQLAVARKPPSRRCCSEAASHAVQVGVRLASPPGPPLRAARDVCLGVVLEKPRTRQTDVADAFDVRFEAGRFDLRLGFGEVVRSHSVSV